MAKPLDSDFEDEDNLDDENDFSFPEDQELVVPEKKGKKDDQEKIEIEIVDDTPEADKGKWVADDAKDGEPDIPDEDEVKNYTKDVQKRINKMTARLHAERRAKEDILRQNNERDAILKRLLEENNNLKGLVENGEKVLIGEHKGRLEGQLAAARALYREAAEAGDTTGIIAAQEKIALVVAQMDRLSTHRPQPLPREELPKFDQQQPQGEQQVQADPRAVEWQKKNPWFGRDDAMTGYALGLHKTLIKDNITPDDDEYYTRINQEMRKRFADRFKPSDNGRRTGSVVAPATRQGRGVPRKVTLTESQARLARRLGLTNEQYAEQLIAEQETGNAKEFTHSKRF